MGKDYILWDRVLACLNHQSSAEVSAAVVFWINQGYGLRVFLFRRKMQILILLCHMLSTKLVLQVCIYLYIYIYLLLFLLPAWGRVCNTQHAPGGKVCISVSNSFNDLYCQNQLSSWNSPFIQATFVLLHQWSWVWHSLTRLVEWLRDSIINSNATCALQQIEFLLTGCLSYYGLIWLTYPFGGVHDLIISLMIKFPSVMCYFVSR